MNFPSRAVTLLELMIAVALFALIILGFGNIEFFSQANITDADRKAGLQHELSAVLAHIGKNLNRAIGNELIDGDNNVVFVGIIAAGNQGVRAYIDNDGSGGTGNGVRDTTNDYWVGYRYRGAAAPGSYQVQYCPSCTGPVANPCSACAVPWTAIGRKITQFTVDKPGGSTLSANYIGFEVQACWNPAESVSVDNPCIRMRNRIALPSVSTN